MRRPNPSSVIYGIVMVLSFLSISYGILEWYNLENEEIKRVINEARLEADEEREKRENADKKAKKEKRRRKRAERELEEERSRISRDRWDMDELSDAIQEPSVYLD